MVPGPVCKTAATGSIPGASTLFRDARMGAGRRVIRNAFPRKKGGARCGESPG